MRMSEDEYKNLLARKSIQSDEPAKPNKYRAQKVEIDGIIFHSKKEGARYQQLKMLEKARAITNLRLQVAFVLAPSAVINGKKKPELKYVADFCYNVPDKNYCEVVEDCKGFRDKVYIIKRHLMKTVHGVDILET